MKQNKTRRGIVGIIFLILIAVCVVAAVVLFFSVHPDRGKMTPQAVSDTLAQWQEKVFVTADGETVPLSPKDVADALSTEGWSRAWLGASGQGDFLQVTLSSDEFLRVHENEVIEVEIMGDGVSYHASAGTFEKLLSLAQ